MMHIWVDADACPNSIKDILYRASGRLNIPLTLVANTPLRIPLSPCIDTILVPGGFDEADSRIAGEINAGDLVITADIPLAAMVLAKGGYALNPRGEFYSTDTIHERLTVRNMLDELRGAGVITGGPAALNHADRKEFADQLDRFLTKQLNK
jgi:uncharacterized protein